jgi:predicted DNA binding CopG/RHH family protein
MGPDIGAKGKRHMRKRIKYTDEPMKIGKIVKDFLPPPDKLTLKKERALTLRLDETTLAWLKEIAEKKGLGLSSLARMWILERLSNESRPPH